MIMRKKDKDGTILNEKRMLHPVVLSLKGLKCACRKFFSELVVAVLCYNVLNIRFYSFQTLKSRHENGESIDHRNAGSTIYFYKITSSRNMILISNEPL
jgi:hypothetical protein